MRRPISRVRSVTETSMMFMMPTPPTTSEMAATNSNSMLINSVVGDKVLVISVMSRMLKSSSSPGWMRWRSWSKLGDLGHGRRDLLGRRRFDQDLVDVGEADGLRRVGSSVADAAGYSADGAGIEVVERVDRVGGSRRCGNDRLGGAGGFGR